MEKRQQKIERVQQRKERSKNPLSEEETTESEGEMDQLDQEHAKKQIEEPQKVIMYIEVHDVDGIVWSLLSRRKRRPMTSAADYL